MIGHSESSTTILNSYTTAHIITNQSTDKRWGALIGFAANTTIKNVHWLYYVDNGVEYAIAYSDSMGVPINTGAIKHTRIGDYYT